MIKTVLGLSILALALSACSKPQENKTAPTQNAASEVVVSEAVVSTPVASEAVASATNPAPASTTETSLDWNGTYEGVLPCASCEGLKTTLVLNPDKTYELTEEYLGKGKGNTFKVKGTFKFDQTTPAVIQLDKAGNNRKFSVAEGSLQARAVETGEEITGPIAAEYKLKKVN